MTTGVAQPVKAHDNRTKQIQRFISPPVIKIFSWLTDRSKFDEFGTDKNGIELTIDTYALIGCYESYLNVLREINNQHP